MGNALLVSVPSPFISRVMRTATILSFALSTWGQAPTPARGSGLRHWERLNGSGAISGTRPSEGTGSVLAGKTPEKITIIRLKVGHVGQIKL
jgi:hypothetical protein